MIYLHELLAAGGRLYGEARAVCFSDWSYDSRLTTPGECFVALRTSRADGHDYISAAIAAGAIAVLCSWPPADPGAATVVLADDPQALLLRWATARLSAVSPLVVAVTGSVGKTSSRRAIAAVLAHRALTFQSRRSFNSLPGLPIAFAQLDPSHRYAVIEFGSDRQGEITQLATAFPPQIGLVTAVDAAHLRTLGSLDAIAQEKGDLLAALPADGLAIINADTPYADALAARSPARVLRYGQGEEAELRGLILSNSIKGSRLRLHWQGRQADADTALLGSPGLYACLAAVAVGLSCGMSLADCANALAEVMPAAGRLRSLPARGGAVLIDDSYSAAPPAAFAALETLVALPARRRIAVLGELSQLPPGAEKAFYTELGTRAAHSADQLILKGDWGLIAARAALEAHPDLPVTIVDTAEAAVAALPADLGLGDLILIKGGAEARLERVAARLVDVGVEMSWREDSMGVDETPPHIGTPLETPRRGISTGAGGTPAPSLADLLVRQEPAWHNVRIGAPDRPTWLRVDLDALAGNIRRLRALSGVPLMAVLKGDAYGHGAVRVARAALGAGAVALAVATLGEGRTLRQHDIFAPILVLGYTPPWQAQEAIALGLDCTLFDDDIARAIDAAARAAGRVARVHIKVDTGMARLGLDAAELGPFLHRLHELPGLDVAGLYTHFASADAVDLSPAELQLARFQALLGELELSGLRPPLVHAANSAAALRLPKARFDMIRPGIACYGLHPGAFARLPEEFRPALSFHSEVAQVKEHPAGTPISYGGRFVTRRPSRIATIPAGYADGLRRSPPWREILVRGQRAPVVGQICMDYIMVDVSDIPGVRRGDAVVLIGRQGDATISADEVAEWLGTISYEVVTSILSRVPREVA